MNTQTALSAYKTHTLDIQMKTSSGDLLTLHFGNKQTLNANSSSTKNTLLLSNLTEFSFSIDSNGLDPQDKQEIDAFMQLAKPFIDNFLQELQEQNPTSPINKVAQNITNTLSSLTKKEPNSKNYAKQSLVQLFDKSLEETKAQSQMFDTLFANAKKLLEKTLELFDTPQKPLYA